MNTYEQPTTTHSLLQRLSLASLKLANSTSFMYQEKGKHLSHVVSFRLTSYHKVPIQPRRRSLSSAKSKAELKKTSPSRRHPRTALSVYSTLDQDTSIPKSFTGHGRCKEISGRCSCACSKILHSKSSFAYCRTIEGFGRSGHRRTTIPWKERY